MSKKQLTKPAGTIKTKRQSKSAKAGLVMPVSRFQRYLRKGRYAKRISAGAAVYMASVLEYLVAEISELAGNAAKANKRRTISPRHIMLGVRNDEELNRLLANVHIAQGGVIPCLHPALLPKKSEANTPKTVPASQEF